MTRRARCLLVNGYEHTLAITAGAGMSRREARDLRAARELERQGLATLTCARLPAALAFNLTNRGRDRARVLRHRQLQLFSEVRLG